MPNDTYTTTDRFEELDLIDLDGVFGILEIYCDNLVPDVEACLVFLSRILRDQGAASHPQTRHWLALLVHKALALGPFHAQCLDLAHKLSGDPALGARLERFRCFPLEPRLLDLTSVMHDQGKAHRKRANLLDVLKRTPGHVVAASQLLQLDYYAGIEHGAWLDRFLAPKFFQREWNHRLFLHYAGLGAVDRALGLWPAVAEMPLCEVQLNLVAELHAKINEPEQAMSMYRESLRLDPQQTPVRLRLAELETPTRADQALPAQRDVSICLYSWNKAHDLERTLASLAKTDIGKAKIRILLNGCTDRSLEVVQAAKALFPHTDYGLVVLPVNIGAPAARNWLGALPEVRASEFVAYLDDDVELPRDWLAHFITVMARHPKTSVVGCKVVFGSEPRMIQYLYRAFSLASPAGIKLTDPCQIAQFDTGLYDVVRPTDNVMGCCHLLRMAHLENGPQFDLRYSPSQVDDVAHDLALRVRGGEVRYCGLVTCLHHQNTGGGFKRRMTSAQLGQVLGNDTKFFYCFREHLERIRGLMRESSSACTG
jgi:GT2 family glycosyltransferase